MEQAKKTRSPSMRAAKMLKRLKKVRGLNDEEKSVHALGLAATPQERWGSPRGQDALVRLLEALEAEKIRYVIYPVCASSSSASEMER